MSMYAVGTSLTTKISLVVSNNRVRVDSRNSGGAPTTVPSGTPAEIRERKGDELLVLFDYQGPLYLWIKLSLAGQLFFD
jgi:hypothetical protein